MKKFSCEESDAVFLSIKILSGMSMELFMYQNLVICISAYSSPAFKKNLENLPYTVEEDT